MTTDDPALEAERLRALHGYESLKTPGDGAFNTITALAARHFNVPVSLVSLVDEDRIWFHSGFGLATKEISRSPGLCASVILSDDAYVVRDAVDDPRTLANPLVAGSFGLRFYAAAPLRTRDGYRLGTFNILDFQPREFDAADEAVLKDFASIVMEQMELRLETRRAIATLKQAFRNTPDPSQLVTVCAWTNKVRLDGRWMSFEEFLTEKLGFQVSHGIHPDSIRDLTNELDNPS